MNTKIAVSILTIMAVASIAVGGTAAYFSAQETSAANTFTAGTLGLSVGQAVYSVDMTNMKPGDVKTVTLTIANTGTLPLNYKITNALTGAIMLGEGTPAGADDPYVSAIKVDGAAYSNPESLSEALGTDASDSVEVEITFPLAADNDYQGLSGNLAITFDAIQQPQLP